MHSDQSSSTDHFSLTDKIVLVTGANRGIGLGFVHTLLEQGAKKIYATIRNDDYREALQNLASDRVVPINVDLLNASTITQLAEQIDELDILINNAGIATASLCTQAHSLELTRHEMEVNCYGAMRVTQALLPVLCQSDSPVVINIASMAAISHFPNLGPYSIAKAALHSYTQGLRIELKAAAKNGGPVNVVGVYPGPIDTRLSAGADMEKPQPAEVAQTCFAAIAKGEQAIFPDPFSQAMWQQFLEHPQQLEAVFSSML